MSYELFQQGPAAYVPIILVSLIITLLAYCAFPLIFARLRKKTITKRKYKVLCYCVNFAVMILFFGTIGETPSGGPYILWTWIFSASGIKTLISRGVLEEYQTSDYTKTATPTEDDYATDGFKILEENKENNKIAKEFPAEIETRAHIKFCRKCGFKLIEDSDFCSRCGTAVVKE